MNNTGSNVTPIESKRPAPAATHTITYTLEGFPITTTLETSAPIADVIARLKQIGAEPPSAQPTKAAGAPLCPVHNKAMKVSSARPGSYFCTAKDESGAYCKHKA